MKLCQILPADADIAARDADIDVSGVTADSRSVKPGNVFVAIAGGKTDGLRFIAGAVAAGAVAVIAERAPDGPLPAGGTHAHPATEYGATMVATGMPETKTTGLGAVGSACPP